MIRSRCVATDEIGSPERGSFPLDHYSECKDAMSAYLTCLKGARGVNKDECRMLSKAYLQCRMDRNLMAKDTMGNLGFQEEEVKKMGEEIEDLAKETRKIEDDKPG